MTPLTQAVDEHEVVFETLRRAAEQGGSVQLATVQRVVRTDRPSDGVRLDAILLLGGLPGSPPDPATRPLAPLGATSRTPRGLRAFRVSEGLLEAARAPRGRQPAW